MRRAVITGIGAVTPFGIGIPALKEGMLSGRTVFAPVRKFSGKKYGIDSAAEIEETDEIRKLEGSRPSRLLQSAANEAIIDSGLNAEALTERTALVLGTTLGSDEISNAMWQERFGDVPNLAAVMRSMCECGGRILVEKYRLPGPAITIVTACAAGTNAIGMGLDLIRMDRADRVIVGGLDTLTELIYGGFSSIGAIDEVCRPFVNDNMRSGTVLGENAAVLVMEEIGHAVARNARVYAEVLGYGLSNDAYHMTAPAPNGVGAVLAMTRCLQDAGLKSEQVQYVNAHGTGTALNDPVELLALKQVFGDQLSEIPVSSLKSQIGHGLSSAGAIEAIATVLALYHEFLPPTAHREATLDRGVNFVQGSPIRRRINIAISNSFAFGGHAACVALGRW
ncbi:beta-ketoacyl-[acyl-carrier-protein] synthase family protein [Alicyclobacillus tolerans]|uniref:beta-ketoacyl-[acyl-carrier-protein] synthase family protein n=1 Tax=Alicyclobacillus tolerans TaxID=90970 RepID=UPI003B7813BD